MKVIDLLNKIANGEIPKTILYENETYWYDDRENNYYTYIARDLDDEDIEYLFYGDNTLDMLEDEIVIIEEDKPKTRNDIRESYGLPRIKDKKIEKIKLTNGGLTLQKIVDDIEEDIPINSVERTLVYTINEIIDYLEENK